MIIADKLLNKAEEMTFRELNSIVEDNGLRLFSKSRLSDVILKDEILPRAIFDFYTRAHVDFVVTDQQTKPMFIVEYDGPSHADPRQMQRDQTKDRLCSDASLGILRINANHINRRFRGISVLRWIIEVTELEKSFNDAQQAGYVPWDESFDPAMIIDDGKGKKWPYWLSAAATQRLNDFVSKRRTENGGWANIIGRDDEQNLHDLSFCWFENSVIWSKTAVKNQSFQFPAFDLLREIATCDLDAKVQEYQEGKHQPASGAKFQKVCEKFCGRYDAHPSHSFTCGGSAPFAFSWGLNTGWKFS
jgi:very-short-patch-repair endonuclease